MTAMLKITIKEDCGNAPKKEFIKSFCVANAKADIKSVISMVAKDVRLQIYGYKETNGIADAEKLLLEDANRSKVTELIIDNIISHGDRGAANGTLKFEDGGIVVFCTMYTFNSHSKDAKLKLIQTYSITL